MRESKRATETEREREREREGESERVGPVILGRTFVGVDGLTRMVDAVGPAS